MIQRRRLANAILLPAAVSVGGLPNAARAQFPPSVTEVHPPTSAPAATASFRFRAEILKGPSGSHVVVVFVDVAQRETPVIEVLPGAGGLTKMDRAKIIASRLEAAAEQDTTFWKTIKLDAENGETVIVTGQSQPIMTADAPSRRKAGFRTDQEYANALMDAIKQILVPKLR